MRICPSCKATYSGTDTECAIDGELLLEDESVLSLSDTMRSSRGGAVAMRATPAPLVRQNATPTPDRPPDPIVGQHLAGRYEVVRKIGEGGMGVVYLAEREDLGSEVVIKILPNAWMSPARRERFALEQRTQSRLNHPSIARLYDAGALDDGTPWFAMEYVEGRPFIDFCDESGASLEQRLRLFAPYARPCSTPISRPSFIGT